MKIKIAILERDKSYLTRIVTAFGTKYADKLEIYSFTDQEIAMQSLGQAKIDVLLAGDVFDVEVAKLPKRCAFAYLVDSVGIDSIKDQQAICKFQKADLIYKQILSVYSEKASSITGFDATGGKGSCIAFCSASGGVGASTMAAACAVHFAKNGSKVLYLNLERFGSAEAFFEGQGQYDMSDIIFALKSKKTNLHIKLEGCVKQDASGVYYYAPAKIALDMMELTVEDKLRLLSEINLMGEFDVVVLDVEFGLDKDTLKLLRQTQAIVLVGDGSNESNIKTERAHAALTIIEQNSDAPLTDRMRFVYNKVSSKSGQSVSVSGLKELGGARRYMDANSRQIVDQLAALSLFDTIL